MVGDRAAIETLLVWLRPVVLRYTRARVGPGAGPPGTVWDIARDVCLAVIEALPWYDTHGESFHSFVYAIATHTIAEAHPRAGRDDAEPIETPPDPPLPGSGTDAAAHARGLLERLPREQRETLTLRVILGWNAAQTGRALGISSDAVRLAQHRALCELRAALPGGDRDDHRPGPAPTAPNRDPETTPPAGRASAGDDTPPNPRGTRRREQEEERECTTA